MAVPITPPQSHSPGNSPSILPQLPLLCPHQIPREKANRKVRPRLLDHHDLQWNLLTCQHFPRQGSGKAGGLGIQQMTHPLSFSEWRLAIKKQSKGGKRQASFLGIRAPFPFPFPHLSHFPPLPTTRTSPIPYHPWRGKCAQMPS